MIYFDNSATTQPYKEVVELIARLMYEEFGNSSSLHSLGLRAERILEDNRDKLAATIKAKPEELIFTSGGTESVNMALRGTAEILKRSGNHILSSPVEHSAALESLKELERLGYEVEYLEVDEFAGIILDDLKTKLRKDTILVNIMAVNNELGTIEPVNEAAQIIKANSKKTIFHVDAVQAYGKIPVNTRNLNADLISFSSHKIHGPKGVGMLYMRKGTRLHPLMMGGGHERKLRSGTVNVPGIAGFGLAASIKTERMKEDQEKSGRIRNLLIKELMKSLSSKIRINSPEDGVENILNISFKGIKSETLLHFLEMREIYVSSGSACNSKKNAISHVLKAVKIPQQWAEGAIRFSFGSFNTEKEAVIVADAIQDIIKIM
ncbi:MAG: cysteine desulfurase [Clostridiaceae bacterium]|jgi:cysteine desulfurase|nr:cysteine desulfurase [Clostridiaceae bacterium]